MSLLKIFDDFNDKDNEAVERAAFEAAMIKRIDGEGYKMCDLMDGEGYKMCDLMFEMYKLQRDVKMLKDAVLNHVASQAIRKGK